MLRSVDSRQKQAINQASSEVNSPVVLISVKNWSFNYVPNFLLVGSDGGSVGRGVAFDTRDPRFKS